jgi:hypothetical protein
MRIKLFESFTEPDYYQEVDYDQAIDLKNSVYKSGECLTNQEKTWLEKNLTYGTWKLREDLGASFLNSGCYYLNKVLF